VADDPPRSTELATSITLLQRLRTHEPDAWTTAVQLYSGLMYSWCLRCGVTTSDVDDLVQQSFAQAAEKLGQFRREAAGDTFRGWLRTVTVNLCRMHFRKLGKTPMASGGTEALQRFLNVIDSHDEESPPLDADEERREQVLLMSRAMELVRNEFEAKTWELFWRVAVDGRATQQVAEEFSVSTASVRKAKSRVLFQLKQRFAELLD
jgi:RNA polymerase sigma-70 factor, ECF subfamily